MLDRGPNGAETPSQTRLSFLTRAFAFGHRFTEGGSSGVPSVRVVAAVVAIGRKASGLRTKMARIVEDCTKIAKIARAAKLQSSLSSCNLRAIDLKAQ